MFLLATSARVVSEKDDTSFRVYKMIAKLLKDGYGKLTFTKDLVASVYAFVSSIKNKQVLDCFNSWLGMAKHNHWV